MKGRDIPGSGGAGSAPTNEAMALSPVTSRNTRSLQKGLSGQAELGIALLSLSPTMPNGPGIADLCEAMPRIQARRNRRPAAHKDVTQSLHNLKETLIMRA